MANLDLLEGKRAKRVSSQKKHYEEWQRHKSKGRARRAAWHLRKFRADRKAVRKLITLIDAEEQRRADLRIDWNGLEPVGGKKLREVIRWGLNRNPACCVTSTNGGTHTTTSYHYRDQAVDIGARDPGDTAAKVKFQLDIYTHFGASVFAELFGPQNYPWVKNGSVISGVEGDALETLHDTHVHVAIEG